MSVDRVAQLRRVTVWTVIITVLHFLLTTQSHSLHWLHILLAGLFLVPVLISAVAFEARGGIIAAAAVSIVYLLHLLWSWRDSPLANPDQYAWLAIYPIVGVVAGDLVRVANERQRQRDEALIKSRQTEMINGLTGLLTAVNVRDEATVVHSHRVADLATSIGSKIGFDGRTLSDLHLAALVHDIGKAGIPDVILFKHGPLDDEQMATMREHVDIAVSMLQKIPGTDAIARLVAQHHESPDGNGYPCGLTTDEIDPAAAVLRVADVYSALTEERPYHRAMSPEEALGAMVNLAGTKLEAGALAALGTIVQGGPAESPVGDRCERIPEASS